MVSEKTDTSEKQQQQSLLTWRLEDLPFSEWVTDRWNAVIYDIYTKEERRAEEGESRRDLGC